MDSPESPGRRPPEPDAQHAAVEGETEKLRALDLIAMSNRLLDEAASLLDRLIGAQPYTPSIGERANFRSMRDSRSGEDLILLGRALELSASRRHRELYFARSMFNEPAWDILLTLYIRDPEAAPLTIHNLSELVRVPPSSTLRWVGYLAREHLIERVSHPKDRRKSQIRISPKGRSILNRYLTDQGY